MDATALPETIGNFRIVSKLGQGGMGAVYKAVHGTLERDVALKILPAEFSNHPEYVTRFLREARTVAALRHDNIVQVYDAGEQNGQYYIAMELVDGVNLQKFVDDKPKISEEEGLRLLEQAVRGLAAAHAKGLVHRDIKPENMLLGKDNTLRLVDFGLVMESASTTQLTATGACLGTPMYMSPEQADGEQADSRTDLYSLGVSFFRVFTGQPPFSSPTVMNLLFKHKFEAPPDPKTLRPEMSQNVRNLLLHLMAKRREDRPANAQAVVDMIEGIKQGKAVPPPPVFVPPVSGATSVTMVGQPGGQSVLAGGKKTGLIAAAAVVGLLAIGGIAFALSKNSGSPDPTKAPIIESVDYKGKGDDAFKASLYKDARDFYQKAQAEKPSAELEAKINQTKKAIEFERIMESAAALEAKGELEAAVARYTEAMSLDSGTKAKERLESVNAAIAQNKKLNSKEKIAERDAFSKAAADNERAGKYDVAAENYSKAAALSDNQLRVVFADKAAECRRQDYVAKAVAAEELKNYLEAEVWYKKALELKPNDALIAQQLESLQKKIKPEPAVNVDGAFDTAMREGQRALDGADYPRARAQFGAALALKVGDAKATDKLKEAEGRELLVRGDAFRAAGNTKSAETSYTEAIQKCPSLALEAAERIKALGAATAPVVTTPANPAAAAAMTRIDSLVRAQRDAEAMNEVTVAIRLHPLSRDLKDMKTALEGMQASSGIYAELARIGESAISRTRDYRDIDDDDRGRDLKETFEKLNSKCVEHSRAIRPLFLDHNFTGVQNALGGARRDALEIGEELSNAYELCDRKAEKAAEKTTGVKAPFGISVGVGGDKRKAQKYRDVGDSFKKLAEQAKAQGK